MRSRTSLRLEHGVLLFCALLLGGCIFGDDSKSEAQGYGDAGAANVDTCASADCMRVTFAGAAGAKAVPEPFSMELVGVISQPVRWANFDVTVMGARVARGLNDKKASGYDDALRAAGLRTLGLDPGKIYVEIDLKLENKGADEVDYTDRGTWDVVLAGGQRLTSVDTLGVRILPGDAVTTSLHYRVESAVDLHGGKVVLNGEDRETFEPEQIPLDHAYVREFPRRIASIVGQTANYSVDDVALVHVDEAAYDVNYARDGRADHDKRVVWMKAAFTAAPHPSSGSFYATELRIVVDGRASAPKYHDSAVVLLAGTTKVLSAGFEIDKTATHFEIMIPDGTAQGQRFPVDVADTVLAADIP